MYLIYLQVLLKVCRWEVNYEIALKFLSKRVKALDRPCKHYRGKCRLCVECIIIHPGVWLWCSRDVTWRLYLINTMRWVFNLQNAALINLVWARGCAPWFLYTYSFSGIEFCTYLLNLQRNTYFIILIILSSFSKWSCNKQLKFTNVSKIIQLWKLNILKLLFKPLR